MTKLCICMICSCGRHRCPHKRHGVVDKSNKPCLLTEYNQRYKEHPMEMRQSYKPAYEPMKNSGPLEDKTTNRTDYVKHPMEKPFVHQQESYIPPEGSIDTLTNYKRDYAEKPITKSQPIKKDQVKRHPGKFEGEPTYKTDYRQWALDPRNRVVNEPGYRPPSAPFVGQSTFSRDFIRHSEPPRKMLKPAETAKQGDQPFDGRTGYRDDYIRHQLPAKQMKERPKYEPNRAPLDGLSTYIKDYPGKQGQKQESFKPNARAYQSGVPLDSDTTHKVDFKKWPSERPFVHEPEVYVRPEGEMEKNTTTHLDYNKKPIEVRKSWKPNDQKKVPGRFEGTTNYSQDFRKWGPAERAPITMRSGYVPPDAPFEGLATYTSDYTAKSVPVQHSMKPDNAAKVSSEPFDGKTGYRDDFIKYPMQEKQKKEKPHWQPNKAPLDGLTTYNKDYLEKAGPKQSSCKPDAEPYQSNAPFQDGTTQRTDFQKWPTEKPYVREQDQYIKPEGLMESLTTTHLDYNKKPLQKTTSKKPAERKGVPGKFDGTTNYKEDFRKWQPGEKATVTTRADYNPPEAPFEGTSNYTTDFIKHHMDPTKSLKPNDTGYQSGAPFEGDTMYRCDYTKKKLPPCPAAILEGPQSGFKFSDQDPYTGHKFYEPKAVSVSVTSLPHRVKSADNLNKQLTALSVA